MREFLDMASNWAERNDLPLTAYRCEVGDWYAKVETRDGHGWFAVHVPVTDKKPSMSPDKFQGYVENCLSSALVKERQLRIKRFTGRNPAIGRAA